MRRLVTSLVYFAFLAYFGVGFVGVNGLALAIAATSRGARRERLVRSLIAAALSHYLRVLRASRCFVLEAGPGVIAGHVVVANHPSIFDAPLLLAAYPEAVCFYKSALRRSMLGLPAARAAGYIPNDSGVDGVIEATRRLQSGEAVLVFPESTRTVGSTPGVFHKAAAILAIRANAPVACLAYDYSSPLLSKSGGPLRAPEIPLRIRIRRVDTLLPADFADAGSLNDAMRARIVAALSST